MDTINCCSRRCLLWTVLIVLLNQCLLVSSSGRVCPQGQLIHQSSQYVTCCYPTRCGIGHHVRPCTVNGTQDTCQVCSPYQNQSLRTSSYTMEPCTYWPLDPDCRTIGTSVYQRNTSDERTRRCMCNIELGKKFVPPESEYSGAPMDSYCQRRLIECKPGHEPMVDGGCRPCRDNYYKSVEGFELCEPKTDCFMLGLNLILGSDATADNNCSKPEPTTTPKPYVPDSPDTVSQKSSAALSSLTSTAATTPQETGRFGPSQDLGQDDDNFPWPVIGVVLFLVLLVVFIVVVMFWRSRRGMSAWVCSSNKNCTDPEKNYTQGSRVQGGHHNKHGLGDSCVIPQHLTDGDKVINNNINHGGLPCGMTYLPNGHPNGNAHHGVYNHTEHSNGDSRFYADSLQYRLVPTSRPGILRNANHNVVYGQSQANVRDRSIDSIGQEKLQVHVDELEANQDHGESDPLLVTDHLRGVAAPIQNQAVSGNSPPAIQAHVNPLHLLGYNGRANFGTTFVHSGASSPPVQPHGPAVTYAPAAGVVTFTRSTSVIASPEGEVDEDEIEARLPRLSQLLTEGDNPSAVESSPTVEDFFRADSPARETTQQLRAPSQRLIKDQRQGNTSNQQPRRQVNQPTQHPALVGPVPHRGHQATHPDHRIMNLKEQQLEESLSNDPATDRQHKVEPHHKTIEPNSEETQQTELKTYIHQPVDWSTGASVYAKVDHDTTHTTEPKQVDSGNQNLVDRKRQVSGPLNTLERTKQLPVGTNVQSVSDRKRVPSGGSNSSSNSQNTLERQRVPRGDQQRPCIKNSSPEEADRKPHQRYNRTVSFEDSESPQLVTKQRGPSTEGRPSTKSRNSPEKVCADPNYRGPLRSVSDPEQKNMAQIDSDGEETERKCTSLEYNSSSKTSVNSGTDSRGSSPCRTALYRRSQSDNTPSSSESSHKPPPRSMSEEKPQKLDRPIAKVKPMPASDNAINQLSEVSDDTSEATLTANGNGFHQHNSDDSDPEDISERNHAATTALEDDEDMRELDRDVQESV